MSRGDKLVNERMLDAYHNTAIGNLADLETEDKTNIVAAINEVANSGGIPLDAPTGVSITNQDEAALIKWTDPSDRVIDGETVSTWGGTLIVRKVGSPPTSKNDGTIVVTSTVRNQYASSGYVDDGLTNGTTYYYGIFPFTTKNVFTTTEVDSFTPTAIYATAISDLAGTAGNAEATITFTAPADATSVKVVYKAGSAPTTATDGTVVDNATSPLKISGIQNDITYYFKAFTMTAKGRATASTETISLMPRSVRTWGFTQDFSNTDPDTCISYPAGVENANYAKMMTNEGNGTATAGDWDDFLTNVLKNLPYMVKANGEADYQLDPTDYSKKASGGASDAGNTNYPGGAFAWLNKIWMKEEYAADGNGRTVYFSDGEQDGFDPVGFVDSDGNELEGVWLPMGYMDANGKTLASGTTPVASKTCDQEWSIIQGFSSRARHLGGPIVNVLRDLEYMLYKSTDIQKNGGMGRCNAGSQKVVANAYVPNGNVVGFKGTNDKVTMNKAFHSQVLFSYQQWLRDPFTLLVNGVFKYSKNYKYDISGATYETSDKTSWGALNSGWHYGSHMEYTGDGFGSTPKKENTCSTTTGLCDGLDCSTSGTRVARRFGYCSADLSDGPATLSLGDEASSASWDSGVGLLLLPAEGYAP